VQSGVIQSYRQLVGQTGQEVWRGGTVDKEDSPLGSVSRNCR
jgi:hypothetical protein